MSDFKMPRMNGFEFLSNVKKIRPYIQVFLMSAFQIREIEYSNFLPPTTKIDEFIQKPILQERLNALVQNQLVPEESKHQDKRVKHLSPLCMYARLF